MNILHSVLWRKYNPCQILSELHSPSEINFDFKCTIYSNIAHLKSVLLQKNMFDSLMQHKYIVNKAAWYQLLESTIFVSYYKGPPWPISQLQQQMGYGIQMLFLAFWNPHQNSNATCSALTKRNQAVPSACLGHAVHFPGQLLSLWGYWKILLGHHEEKNAITYASVTTAVLWSYAAMNLLLHLSPPWTLE